MPSEEYAPDERSGDGLSPELSTQRLRRQTQRDFEIDFFARILERDPYHVAALRAHAKNLAARGDYNRALQMDRRLVRLQTEKPIPWYNLGCSYAMLGMTEPALDAIENALARGYRHFDHILRDPDLKSLRRDPRLARMLNRYADWF